MVDPQEALAATYAYARSTTARVLATDVVWTPCGAVIVGIVTGATGWRLVQYAIVGAAYGAAAQLGAHGQTAGAASVRHAATNAFDHGMVIGCGVAGGVALLGALLAAAFLPAHPREQSNLDREIDLAAAEDLDRLDAADVGLGALVSD